MKRYINCKTEAGIETLDVYSLKEFKNKKELFNEVLRVLKEYKQSAHNAWISRRATKEFYKNIKT